MTGPLCLNWSVCVSVCVCVCVCVCACGVRYLTRLDGVDAQALHEAQDLLVGLLRARLGVGVGMRVLGRRRRRQQARRLRQHPPVALDLLHRVAPRRVQHQHLADQRLAVCKHPTTRAIYLHTYGMHKSTTRILGIFAVAASFKTKAKERPRENSNVLQTLITIGTLHENETRGAYSSVCGLEFGDLDIEMIGSCQRMHYLMRLSKLANRGTGRFEHCLGDIYLPDVLLFHHSLRVCTVHVFFSTLVCTRGWVGRGGAGLDEARQGGAGDSSSASVSAAPPTSEAGARQGWDEYAQKKRRSEKGQQERKYTRMRLFIALPWPICTGFLPHGLISCIRHTTPAQTTQSPLPSAPLRPLPHHSPTASSPSTKAISAALCPTAAGRATARRQMTSSGVATTSGRTSNNAAAFPPTLLPLATTRLTPYKP
ncbi:Protein of unknown function [Gryllus bimaculatus]|nr:Protein of unknown function [Gryllus bimaculatus]